MIRCDVCKRTVIRSEAEGWWEIIGWSKGGKGTVAARRLTGTVMCEECHLRRKFGGSTGQGDLLAEGTRSQL